MLSRIESDAYFPVVPRPAAMGYAEREFADDSTFAQILNHYSDTSKGSQFLDQERDTRENAVRAEKILRVGELNQVSRAIEAGYTRVRYCRIFERFLKPFLKPNIQQNTFLLPQISWLMKQQELLSCPWLIDQLFISFVSVVKQKKWLQKVV